MSLVFPIADQISSGVGVRCLCASDSDTAPCKLSTSRSILAAVLAWKSNLPRLDHNSSLVEAKTKVVIVNFPSRFSIARFFDLIRTFEGKGCEESGSLYRILYPLLLFRF
jgi:hypothetical protein